MLNTFSGCLCYGVAVVCRYAALFAGWVVWQTACAAKLHALRVKGSLKTAEQQGISLMGLSFLLSVLQMCQQFFAIGKADEGLHEGDGASERGLDFAGGQGGVF